MRSLSSAILSAVILAGAGSSFGAEGMWSPDQIPELSDRLQRIGLEASGLGDLRNGPLASVVQIPGCTAFFASPDGLLITNYHCAWGAIQYNSTTARDLFTDGFLARSRSEELSNGPGYKVWLTTSMRDVTEAMTARLGSAMTDKARYDALERREKRLVQKCESRTATRCRVTSMLEGSRYLLVTQEEFSDVRLVYVPPRSVGEYGGETDNWMWPRHTGDWAFFRVYVGPDGQRAAPSAENVPYRPEHYLRLSTAGVREDEPVYVVGYPGKSYRYETASSLEQMQEFYYPRNLEYLRAVIGLLRGVGSRDEESRLKNSSFLQSQSNYEKGLRGTMEALIAGRILERRRAEEARLTEFLRKHPGSGDPRIVEKIDAVERESRRFEERNTLLYWMVRSASLLRQAVQIYRFGIEVPKKDIDRQWGFQQRDLQRLREMLERSQRSLDVPTEKSILRYFLLRSQELPRSQRIPAVDDALADPKDSPIDERVDALVDHLYAATTLGSEAERVGMLGLSSAKLDEKKDPLLQFAASLVPLLRENEDRYQRSWAAMTSLRPRYMAAMQQMRNEPMYSDANGTPRFSFGRIAGYSAKDGIRYAPRTTTRGLIEKETGAAPFHSPPLILDAAAKGDWNGYGDAALGAVPVNFLSDCDNTGGSSGSPTLNAAGEVVGILFDGNYEAMASDYVFSPGLTRAIHVDSRYMLWVMDLMGADALLQELGRQPHLPR